MRLALFTLCLAFVGCKAAEVREASVDEDAQLIEAGAATPSDANTYEQRLTSGTLPGAKLLALGDGETLKGVPADKGKAYIFYCSNRM